MGTSLRTIQILINALTNTQGFEDAQKGLVDVAERAKAAGIGLDSTGKSARKMGEEMGGKRGQVADLTRVILMEIGATQGAGEAAKLAGIGLNFMEGAASGLNIAMAGATAGIAFIIPLLLEYSGAADKQKQANEGLKDSFSGILEKIDEVISKGGQLSAVQDALARSLKTEEYRNQVAELKNYGDRLAVVRNELDESVKQLSAYQDMMANIRRGQGPIGPEFLARVSELEKKIEGLRDEEGKLTAKGRALEQAMLDGTTVGGELDATLKGLALAHDTATKAAESQKRAQEELNKAFDEGRLGVLETRLKEIAFWLKKDSDALHEQEESAKLGILSPELFDRLTALPPPAEQFAVALGNIGLHLDEIVPTIEDINAAFEESRKFFDEGIISGRTLQVADQQLLQMIDHLRQIGVAVQSPFTMAQEMTIDLRHTIDDELVNSAMAFGDAIGASLVGAGENWNRFFKQLLANLSAAIIKAVILRLIMASFGFSGGGAVGIDKASPGGFGALEGGFAAGGGLAMGGLPGMDSVRAFLTPGEVVLPPGLSDDFREFAGIVRDSRQARAGRSAYTGPELAMAVQIMPRRDRMEEAGELLADINTLVEHRGYRLVATQVK